MAMRGFGFELTVAVRFLREGRFQSVLIIVGVAAGVAVVAYISALVTGLQSNTLNKTLGAQAHVVLTAPDERVTPVLERRPGEARPHLRAAAEAFARLGAGPWRARAEVESRAAGDTGWPATPPGREGLTPQEGRVAHAVARGATNREAAAELSLSHKTVEHHLGRVYAKLGVRSRTELALLLGDGRAVESPDT